MRKSGPNRQEKDSKHSLRVLIADPHRDCAQTLQMLLNQWGHSVVVVASPDDIETVDMIDVALVDPFARSMRNHNMAMLLHQRCPHAVLLAHTGWGQREDIHKCLQQGFHEHLLKPYKPAYLQSLLSDLSSMPDTADSDLSGIYRELRLLRWQCKKQTTNLLQNMKVHQKEREMLSRASGTFLMNVMRIFDVHAHTQQLLNDMRDAAASVP